MSISTHQKAMLNAVLQNKTQEIEALVKKDFDLNESYGGLTLLDLALIYDLQETAVLLKQHGAIHNLSPSQISKQQHASIRKEISDCFYQINVGKDQFGHPEVQIITSDSANKDEISRKTITHANLSGAGSAEENIAIRMIDDKPCIIILDEKNNKPIAMFQVVEDTHELQVLSIHAQNASFSIFSKNAVSLKKNIDVKHLVINAPKLDVSKDIKVQANEVELSTTDQLNQNGVFIAGQLRIFAGHLENYGQLIALEKFDVECKGQFNQYGTLVATHQGRINAHSIELYKESCIQVSDGELNLFGRSKIKNSGVLIADYMTLDSNHLVVNHFGGLIKAVSCIIPNKSNHFSNSGFYLIGRKNSLTMLDKAFCFASGTAKVAGFFSALPTETLKKIENGLLLGKTIYHGAGILNKMYQGKAKDISSGELVNLMLDQVIPCLGAFSNEEEKSRFICNVFYQFFGWYLGEEAFIDKSLNVIEMLIRGAATFSGGAISADNIATLESTAKKIQAARMVLKFAESGYDATSAYFSGDPLAISNAKDTLISVAESSFREWLQTLQTENMFGMEFNPKDLAIFVLNKGHQQSFEVGMKRAVYAFIYALHKSDKLSDDLKTDYQYCAQVVFSGPVWARLFKRYQSGDMTYSELLQQTFNQVTAYASYIVTKKQIQKQLAADDVINEASEATKEDVPKNSELEKSELEDEMVDDGEPLNIPEETDAVLSDELPLGDNDNKPTEAEIEEEVAKTAEEMRVSYDRENFELTFDVEQLVDNILHPKIDNETAEDLSEELNELNTQSILTKLYAEGIQSSHVQSMLEIQRVIDGDYATQGFMGAFANVLHNDGMLDVVGNMQFDCARGNNSSLMRATSDIRFNGKDIHNRDNADNVISAKTAQSGALSTFTNEITGSVNAGGHLQSLGMGQIDNDGDIQAKGKIEVKNTKQVVNHEAATMQSDKDMLLQADGYINNAGRIAGENITLEGVTEQVNNSGDILAQEEVRLASANEVNHDDGCISGQKVFLSGVSVNKHGKINALQVKVGGYHSDMPDNLSWGAGGADDNIFGLILKPGGSFEYAPDAFNGTQITDLQLQSEHLSSGQLLKIDANFDNTLQLQLPGTDRVFSVSELPTLAPNAIFVLHAPGSTLEAMQANSFDYQSILHFVGENFQHSGVNTFQKAYFDVQKFSDINAVDNLHLKEGGGIQAQDFSNIGHLQSGGMMQWNIDDFSNNAQLEEFSQSFQHSKENPVWDEYTATRVTENSGSIHAESHSGYIGNLEQTGGSFTSGDGGNFLYIKNSKQNALFSHHGISSRGVLEDVGWSWHILPESHNAKIGSSGENVLLGTGKMVLAGAEVWGDKGNHCHFNEGIETERSAAAYTIHQAKRHARGKNRETTVAYQELEVVSQNHLDADDGSLVLAAGNGSVNLSSTVLTTPGNAALIAKDKVIIDGEETHRHEQSNYKIKGPLHTKKVSSTSDIGEVQSSYLFVGGTLTVSCLDFQLNAVKGVVGHMDVTALDTTLAGKQETYENTTITQDISISLPCDNLISILSGHNAKAIFSTIIQNYGWNQSELDALMNAESMTEVPGPLLNVAKNAWNLTALVAHACNEYNNGTATPGNFVGGITDQIGLTTKNSDGKHVLNPKIRLNVSKNKEHTKQSHTVSTDLYIGGTFKLRGGTLNIYDGSKINAKDLIISLANGINMTKALDTSSYHSVLKTGSLGVNVLNPKDFDVSVSKSTSSSQVSTARLAGLEARETANIEAEYIRGEGRIEAVSGKITAPEISLSSAQSSYKSSSQSASLQVSTSLGGGGSLEVDSIGGHYHRSKTDILSTDETAGIFMQNGMLHTNQAHLENGAVLDVQQLHRADDVKGLPTVTGTAAYDHHIQKENGFSVHVASESEASIQHLREHEDIIHRPSVYADNIQDGDFLDINTSRETESEVTRSSRKAISLAVFDPNIDKYKRQCAEIKEAGGHIRDGISDLLEPDNHKSLHFAFDGSNTERLPSSAGFSDTLEQPIVSEQIERGNKDEIPESIIQSDAPLPADNAFVSEHFETEKEEDVDSELNGGFSAIPGLASLQASPGAVLHLAELSVEKIYRQAEIQDDFQNGRSNSELAAMQQAEDSKDSSIISDILDVLNPISTAQAGALSGAMTLSEVRILGATGALHSGPRNVLDETNLYQDGEDASFDGSRPARQENGNPYTVILRDEFNDKSLEGSALVESTILDQSEKGEHILTTPIIDNPGLTILPGTSLNPIEALLETFPIHQEESRPLIFPIEKETGPSILGTPYPDFFLPQYVAYQSKGAENIATHEDLKKDLEIRTCDSIFRPDGKLTESAISDSKKILDVGKFNPGRVTGELSTRGDIDDWGKYRTPRFYTPTESQDVGKSKRNVVGEVHFYKNKKTGEVYYELDYKVKYDLSGNPQRPVKNFLEEIPDNWRPKP